MIGSLAILATVAVALAIGGLRPVDDLFDGLRFKIVTRSASQNLTIVEIDAQSLEKAGAWPWDRERYARVVDQLLGGGATLVAFDVDFSAPSIGSADEAFADAISRHPGQVALGTFVQSNSYLASTDQTVENRPIGPLLRDAVVASVNVPVDTDGIVRRYDFVSPAGQHPSIAGILAGANRGGNFAIDYGIKHQSISHLSFDDVLEGRFDPDQIRGRAILIGATALELGDEFATPVGLIPGVVIHGLAYESIVGGRALIRPSGLVLLLLCLVVAVYLQPRRQGQGSVRILIVRHGVTSILTLGLAIVIQMATRVSVPVAPLLVTQFLFGVWAMRVELARRARAIIDEREAGLVHLAMHQPDTGLPNRRALLARIEDDRNSRPDRTLCVVTVEVERHAEMRGVVGYDIANRLMTELATRVAEVARTNGVVQVSSSVLAFTCDGANVQVIETLNRLRAIETNFNVEGHSIDIYLRFGAAIDGQGSLPTGLLVERSTLALNKAKDCEDRFVIYDDAVFGSPANNLALMSEMLAALENGEISLHYQPKMQTADNAVTSVEALCRWNHPQRGFVPPDLFIPIAEETGQIRALTEWSFLRAIQDQERLRALGHDLTIALNVSGRLLADDAFKDKVLEFASSVESKICLEITETAVIDHPERATEAIAAFRAAGLKISIDDYGSGLSSLGYLKLLNADELKVDKSLVVEVATSQRDRLIMRSTIDLAHGLGMSVVAEGVEDETLAACLSLLGCDLIQGYWLSRPLPLPKLVSFLDDRSSVLESSPYLAKRAS